VSASRKTRRRQGKRRRKSPSGKKAVEVVRPEVVDALLTKLKGDQDIALSAEEKRVLAGVLETWAHVVERAQRNELSISQLRELLGILLQRKKKSSDSSGGGGSSGAGGGKSDDTEASSTKDGTPPETDEIAPASDSTADTSCSQGDNVSHRDEHGRRSVDDFPEAAICLHNHPELSVGCRCPACSRGKLYKYQPSQYMTISGQPVFTATQHIVEQLQCNLCDAIFKAPLSEEARLDGADGRTLYSYSAVAQIAIFKFFGVVPWHRMETVQAWMGTRVPDASMFDQCERLANTIAPVVKHLRQLAANAQLFLGDDTGACVLNERSATIAERRTGKLVQRTGCHTTCVIAVTREGHRIVHFFIGIQHTGEMLDGLLIERAPTLAAPMVMSDALSANSVTVCAVRECYCNAHAVRNFKELEQSYPTEAGYATERYKQIFVHEDHCQEQQMSAEQRLAYHREHSKPLFKEICTYGFNLIENKEIEPNSDIGRAYNYLLNHEYELSAFYRYPGAPIDNNLTERTLRLPVHLRDAAPFYRNAVGASIAASILTVGVTAYNAGVNLLDYFVAMLRHSEDVKARPYDWLPWCYEDRVRILENKIQTSTSTERCSRKEEDVSPVPIVYSPVGKADAAEPEITAPQSTSI
jgi:hypothetical protein